MTTIITAVVDAGSFDFDMVWASAYVAALESVAKRFHPDAEIDITFKDRQSGGGFVSVMVDGDEDADAAELLEIYAGREANEVLG